VSKKYHVHDDLGSKLGQRVKFVASRPYSKIKKWKIIDIEEKLPVKSKSKQKKASKRKENKRK
jgi:ribosomal protein S17